MKKKEEYELKENLNILLDNIEEIFKLSALADKFCEQNKDSDDIYELSTVIKLIKNGIDEFSHDLYRTIHMHDKPFKYEELGEKMKKIIS